MKVTKMTIKAAFKKSVNYKSFDAELAVQVEFDENDNIKQIMNDVYAKLNDACIKNVDTAFTKYFQAEEKKEAERAYSE